MEKPKLVVDQVFVRFSKFAKELLAEFGEPRALALVVDWEVGQNDFPAGSVMTREGESQPEVLLRLSSQMSHLNQRVLAMYSKAVEEHVETLETQQRAGDIAGHAASGITDSA